jgi:hypothetical protein
MVINFLFTVIFILGVYYLIRYQINLKKSVEITKDALYPTTKNEFARILLPGECKEMEPLTKNTKSYQYVKWGTLVALILLSALLGVVLVTDWVETYFFSLAYLFFAIISAIKHKGNLFILSEGLILNGIYYSANQIKSYKTEKIVRWHELYGLNSRVDNSYKLTLKVRKSLFQPNFFIVEEFAHLEQILTLLEQQGISGIQKIDQPKTSVEKAE